MSEQSAWSQVWKINGSYLRGCACGGIAWLCWQGFQAGEGWLVLIAAMYAGGAVFYSGKALFGTIKAIAGTMRWSRFRKGHATPKADPIAKENDLRAKGILK